MIQLIKGKPLLKFFASIEFKHKKNNFYVYVRSKRKMIAQISCGNVIGYNKKSSKRQKIKHVSEQLAEVSANRVNTLFYRRKKSRLLKQDSYKIYKKLGLKDSFLRLLTGHNYSRYVYLKALQRNFKKARSKKKLLSNRKLPRVLNFMPSFISLYIIATSPFNLIRRKMTRSLRRYRRLKRKYPKVYIKKLKFDKKRARSLFFRFVFKSKNRRRKPRYFKRVKIKKLL